MRTPAAVLAAMLVLALPPAARPQETAPPSPPPEAVREVVPGPHYEAGALHRFIFGNHYRTLWTAPLTAELLDLRTFSGGLTARKKGGGRQTKALKFRGADGREWKFRSLDKDPSAVLPPDLRGTFVDAIVQDQISAANPAAPLVVDALSEAAGIPHVPHRIVVLPDDPALGEFRAEFGGLLGLLEEEIRVKPPVTPGFERFTRLLDTVELWERLDEHPEEKVDGAAYLRARLFDVFLGDFDRHKDQWQWAKAADSELWQPVPEDRDQAFAKYDGFALWLVRPSHPDLVDFGSRYPGIFGLTWTGRYLDRRHLAELAWPEWDAVIRDLQSRLGDAVIDDAVRALPAEHYSRGGAVLAARLKARRDALPDAARRFYRQLADEVEIHGSSGVENVEITPGEDGTVRVTITGDDGQTRFQRSFRPQHTDELRLHLKGGDDKVVREAGTSEIKVRVIGGPGDDVLDDTRSGGTRFYDSEGNNRVLRGSGTRTDERPYTHPPDRGGQPARDWGRALPGMPLIGGGGDLGLFLGGRIALVGYGFRRHPYAYQHAFRGGFATALQAAQGQYDGEVYRDNSRTRGHLTVRASQIDILRFYGLGNETVAAQDEDFFRVEQSHFLIEPSVIFGTGRLDLQLGLVAQHSSTPTPESSFIGQARPYGVGDFGQAGLRARATLGARDLTRLTSGVAWLTGTYYPELWSVESAFGTVAGQAAAFVAPQQVPLAPYLGFRIGGKKVYGTFPFHEAAFLGGPDQVRGLRPQRYAGEASLFGSAELHLRLAEIHLLLPTEIGVMGMADIGRVWAEDEDSDEWHSGVGGGVWLAPLNRGATMALALARSEGKTRFYIQAGFGF